MTLAAVVSLLTPQSGFALSNNARRRTPESEERKRDNVVANALENYVPPRDATASLQTPLDTPKAISGNSTTLPSNGQTVSAKAVLERIIKKWERDGVNPECIAFVRRLRSSGENFLRGPWRCGVQKLTEELERTGEWAKLRQQAIDRTCSGERWEKSMDKRAAQEPAVSRDVIKQRMTASFFAWNPDSPAINAFTLATVIGMTLRTEDATWEPPSWELMRDPLRTAVYYPDGVAAPV